MTNAPTSTTAPPRPRLADIDRAKGLAILFVVLGHLTMREYFPEGNEWFKTLRAGIYTFHMPFFMYLSGLVLFYSGAALTSKERYRTFLKKRAWRLLLPFMAMGLLILFGKAAARLFMAVDGAPADLWGGLTALVWNTGASPATSIWYLFVMFAYSVILPPLLWLSRGKLWPVLALSIALYLVPFPSYVYLDKITHFLPFFFLGGLAAQNLERYNGLLARRAELFFILFLASFSLLLFQPDWTLSMAVIGTLSLPALHGLVRTAPFEHSQTLSFFGKYCTVIYIFNTIFIGLAKGLMFHIISWDGLNFLLYIPILFASGVCAPILLKKYVFSKIRFLDEMTA